ncbi:MULTISPECIES: hypothetical protein [unclassified Burkholderia]|uniref:hypothetical protein n=1 Tax=unclassified Burkholderia TaxID=2613784 RepID=UPI000AC3C3AD|nr:MULTISPECIES: hypothetical protein [unclassified Burkholderia]
MKSLLCIFFLMFLSQSSFAATDSCKSERNKGEVARCHIELAYKNATAGCTHPDGSTVMSGACSGVVIRATDTKTKDGEGHPVWSYIDRGGVSFSYLRMDSNFKSFAYGHVNGFIIYPVDHTPSGKAPAAIKCAFPFDGDTVNRINLSDRLMSMCGMNRHFEESRPCKDLSPQIKSDQGWYGHYKKFATASEFPNVPSSAAHSCGFVLDGSDRDGVDAFNTFINSRNYAINENNADGAYFNAENEVVVKQWDLNKVSDIPIEAFFYQAGSPEGLKSAQINQMDYYKAAGDPVPIIKITLPNDNKGAAKFEYSGDDQAVPIP